ncbi:MAG: TorF family putative porin [Rhizomicrobium sp.]
MKNLGMKLMLGAASLAGVMASTGAAYADDDWGTVSAYVDVTSDYRFRGISQNAGGFAPQASINWSGPDGFYVGTWISKTNWIGAPIIGGTPSYELDLYGGKHFDLGGTDLNVEAYYYAYPDANSAFLGPKKASYFEGIFQLSHSFGNLALTATGAVSPEFSLGGGTGGYIEGTASYPLLDWLSISGNVGHQWVDAAPTDYTHFDLGLTATYRHWSLDVRANGTDLSGSACRNFYMPSANFNSGICTTGVVATLTYNIPDVLNP